MRVRKRQRWIHFGCNGARWNEQSTRDACGSPSRADIGMDRFLTLPMAFPEARLARYSCSSSVRLLVAACVATWVRCSSVPSSQGRHATHDASIDCAAEHMQGANRAQKDLELSPDTRTCSRQSLTTSTLSSFSWSSLPQSMISLRRQSKTWTRKHIYSKHITHKWGKQPMFLCHKQLIHIGHAK